MDLFGNIPEDTGEPEIIICGRRTYHLRKAPTPDRMRKADPRYGEECVLIAWVEPGKGGVVGGYHATTLEAMDAIDKVEVVRADH